MNINNINALAVGAHPDDVEFTMSGTLLLLKNAGANIHIWTIANGNCGSASLSLEETAKTRIAEAEMSAYKAGAEYHRPITGDLQILYTEELIRKAAAVLRTIKPSIILLPSPQDYMEDHQSASRIVVTAAFTLGMKNYITIPEETPWMGDTFLYHSMPHGLRDGLRKIVHPGQYVDVSSVMDTKKEMLACHKSQKEWLDVSQGMDSYISIMESMAEKVGSMSGKFRYAEGWRRHSHLGMSQKDNDILGKILGELCITDDEYEKSLEF